MRKFGLLGSSALRPAVFVGLAVAVSSPSFAQDVTPADNAPGVSASDEQIVVTGSRIRRPNLDSTVPIMSLGSAELIDRGSVSLGDALNELPALRATYSQANSTRFIGTAGLNLLDLRGLGTSRTLVLVNGRRHVTAVPGSLDVDTNTIPTDLLDRVDIVTGGNSSIYGSDAVAGAVNFILKRDFEGVRVRGQGGISTYGDAGSYSGSITVGQNFFDNRVNIAGNIEYAKQDILWHTDRDDQTGALSGTPVFGRVIAPNKAQPGVPQTQFMWGNRHSSVSLGGMVSPSCPALTGTNQAQVDLVCTGELSPTGTRLAHQFVFMPDGSLVRNDPTADLRPNGGGLLGGQGATLLETTMLRPGLERIAGNLFINADISPSFQPYVEAKFVRVNAEQAGQPTFGSYSHSIDNPFLTQQARDMLLAINPTATRFSAFRFNTDFGARGEDHRRDTFRIVAGATGDITSNLRYDASVNFGRTDTKYSTAGNIHNQRFDNARDAVIDPVTGQIVCAINLDPATRDPNCVPVNLFGSGAVSQAALDYFGVVSTRNQWAEQLNAVAFISGDSGSFFELPGGPIGFVLGGEYRRESAYSAYDEVTRNGETFLNAISTFAPPALTVKEAFGEVRFPLLANTRFAHELSVEAAGRVSDYSAGPGTVYAWNIGGTYAPVKDLRFRAALAASVRAPTLSNLFATGSDTFASIQDPCDAEFIKRNPNRAANCAAAGVPATETLPDGSVVDWYNRSSATLLGRNQGNPNAREERGRSFTAGAVFQPSFVPGLTLSVDYYKIKITDVIFSLGGQTVINLCYDSPSGIDNQYCAAVFRRPDGTFAGQDDRLQGGVGGPIVQLGRTGPSFLSQPFNFAKLETSGIDVDLTYRKALADNVVLNLHGVLSYVIDREQYTDVTRPEYATRLHGTLGDPVWAANLNANLDLGKFDLTYSLRYVGRQTIASWATHFSHQGRPAEAPDLYPFAYYPAATYHNLRLNIDPTDQFRLYAGVDNLFNQLPPYNLSAVGYSTDQFSGGASYPNTGRFFYAGAEFRF